MNDDVTKVGKVSNFVTDDGKDLDERYLGINAKAKSAESADSVGSIDISKVTGFDVPRVYGSRVDLNVIVDRNTTKTWEAPSSGLLAIHGFEYNEEGLCKLNETNIGRVASVDDNGSISNPNSGYFPVQKDDVFSVKADYRGNRFIASFYPLQLIKEVTENE